MAKDTKIEWTDHTFNPWIGCTKVSPGCAHCYAETLNKRMKWVPAWGGEIPRKRTSPSNWRQPHLWNARAFFDGTRPRVFCASLADWLDDQVPIEWLQDLIKLIFETPCLDWLLLTKRPENFHKRISYAAIGDMSQPLNYTVNPLFVDWSAGRNIPNNVWIGTTAEDQDHWDRRLPLLRSIPAKVHFVSAEPLLGPIEMGHYRPDWLIVGGESGPGARPVQADWVRDLRNQCHSWSVPFFFKQWGGPNKKAAGRILDGRTWEETPDDPAQF